MPWDYWQKDGTAEAGDGAHPRRARARDRAHPDHAGAHHYHIHLIEASRRSRSRRASADRLGALMPAAGHMVHMPAHIYIRVGRYADAAEANVRAIAADEDYLAQCQAQGLYPVSYYPHNLHFLWAAATFEGRGRWPSMPRARSRRRCRITMRARWRGRRTFRSRRAGLRALRALAGDADRAEAAGDTSRTRSASGTTDADSRSSRADELDRAGAELAALTA